MSVARCGTRAAIVAHLEYGEPLDGPCALADAAMRLEAEARRPYSRRVVPVWDDSPAVCAHRLAVLDADTLAWEAAHPGFDRGRVRRKVRSSAAARTAASGG